MKMDVRGEIRADNVARMLVYLKVITIKEYRAFEDNTHQIRRRS